MNAERYECIRGAKRPKISPYDHVKAGRFIRNLEPDRVANRFPKDGKPPKFGYRLRPNKWRWDDRSETDGLSVNCEECTGNSRCSVLFHPTPDRFQHVVIIDLEGLAKALGFEIVAIYDPDPGGTENPCHFNLRPIGKTIEDLRIAINSWNDTVCSPMKLLPASDDLVVKAVLQREEYERVFKVELDVHVRNEGSASAAQESSLASTS